MTKTHDYEEYTTALRDLRKEVIFGTDGDNNANVDPFEEQHMLAAIAAIDSAAASFELANLHKAKALGAMQLNR